MPGEHAGTDVRESAMTPASVAGYLGFSLKMPGSFRSLLHDVLE